MNKTGKTVVKAAPLSEVNVKDTFTSHIDKKIFLTFLLTKKIRLIRSLKKFIFRYQDLVEIYSVSAEKIINDAFSYSEIV
jgi:hypothetical protein